jgi:hypothetical protein
MEKVKIVERQNMWGRPEKIALVKGANIMNGKFRNFSGKKEGPYDQPGKRYFNIQLDDPNAAITLKAANFPVKLHLDEMGNVDRGYLRINVKPEGSLPCIVRVEASNNITPLDVESYDILDGLGGENDTMITGGDLTLRIWDYKNDGQSFTCQLEEGIFHLQPISFWTDAWAEEEYPHE